MNIGLICKIYLQLFMYIFPAHGNLLALLWWLCEIFVTGSWITFLWLCQPWDEELTRMQLLFTSLAIMLGLRGNTVEWVAIISVSYYSINLCGWWLDVSCAWPFDLWLQSTEEKYFIHNHLSFNVKYHRDLQTETSRIVGFEVKPFRYFLFGNSLFWQLSNSFIANLYAMC